MPSDRKFFFPLFTVLAALLGILMPILSSRYAVTWDEWMDSNYGFLILKYILSAGTDTSYSTFWHGYLYSGFFFTLTGLLSGLLFDSLPHFIYDGFFELRRLLEYFQFSHAVNSLFGFYLFFFTGLCAKEAKGWRSACAALILTAASPRIFGHAMNNPKDIPFAAAYMFTAYLMIRFFKQFPRPSWSSTAALALSLGISLGVRVGGILLSFYLIFFGVLLYFKKRGRGIHRPAFLPWMLRLSTAALYGYLVGLIFWPFGQINPFLHIFRAMAELSDFKFSQGDLLYQGQIVSTSQLPWHYIPLWICITTPVVVLTGWFLFAALLRSRRSSASVSILFFLGTLGLFPIAAVIVKHSVVYNDWRHLYFVYGPLAVLAAVGWDFFFDSLRANRRKAAGAALFAALAAMPIGWMIRNHPYQALYFNALTGGVQGAAGRYDMDYWGQSLRSACEWLADYHNLHYPEQSAVVHADGHIMSSYAVLRNRLGSRYVPYLYPDNHLLNPNLRYMHIRYNADMLTYERWDYGIFLLNKQTLAEIKGGNWPPANTLHEVKVGGLTVCAVVKNPDSPLFSG